MFVQKPLGNPALKEKMFEVIEKTIKGEGNTDLQKGMLVVLGNLAPFVEGEMLLATLVILLDKMAYSKYRSTAYDQIR